MNNELNNPHPKQKHKKSTALVLTLIPLVGLCGAPSFYLGNRKRGTVQLGLVLASAIVASALPFLAEIVGGGGILISWVMWLYDLVGFIRAKESTERDPGEPLNDCPPAKRFVMTVFCPKACLYDGDLTYMPYESKLPRELRLAIAAFVILLILRALL